MNMKLLFLLFYCTLNYNCYSQKVYTFDYLLKYQNYTYDKDSISKHETSYFLTNSKDNSYIVVLKTIDDIDFELVFHDENGKHSNVKVRKEAFFDAEFIHIKCNNVMPYENRYIEVTKDYKFSNLPDTLLNGVSSKRYKTVYVGEEIPNKSLPIGVLDYILKDSTEFHLPILRHSTIYEAWKRDHSIPNGIYLQKAYYDYKNRLETKSILQHVMRTDKKIVIPKDCE